MSPLRLGIFFTVVAFLVMLMLILSPHQPSRNVTKKNNYDDGNENEKQGLLNAHYVTEEESHNRTCFRYTRFKQTPSPRSERCPQHHDPDGDANAKTGSGSDVRNQSKPKPTNNRNHDRADKERPIRSEESKCATELEPVEDVIVCYCQADNCHNLIIDNNIGNLGPIINSTMDLFARRRYKLQKIKLISGVFTTAFQSAVYVGSLCMITFLILTQEDIAFDERLWRVQELLLSIKLGIGGPV